MLAPSIKELAEENPDIKVCTANVDETMDIAQEYKVSVIPTIVAFKDGKVVEVLPGTKFKVELTNGIVIMAYLAGKVRSNNIRVLEGAPSCSAPPRSFCCSERATSTCSRSVRNTPGTTA